MLNLTAHLQTALQVPISASDSISRNRSLLFEIYDGDHYPDGSGLFNPADAIVRWAKHDCTWLANLYLGKVVSHSGLTEYITGQFNSITLTIENADRYLAQFCATHNVNGLRLVVRYVNWDYSTVLADSRQWVLRLQAPDNADLDREQGDLTAREELASLDIQVPRKTVSPEDPEGRSPNDVEYEGFVFAARPSSVRYVETSYARRALIFLKKKETVRYNQWSSQSGSEDAVVPLGLGRVQLEGLPVFSVDIGFYIVGIWVAAGCSVVWITNFQLPDSAYIFYGPWATEDHKQLHVHLGDLGGTGTNAAPDTIDNTYPQNTWTGSRTAYIAFAIGGPESETQPFANPQMDATPTLVFCVGFKVELPDGGGNFVNEGFSDSPVYAARHVLTSSDYFGLDPRLIYDGDLVASHNERQRPILDKSNGEFLALMQHDVSQLVAGNLTRLNSSGLLDVRYFRHLLDSAQPDPLKTNRGDAFAVSVGGENPSGGDQQLTDGVTLAGQTVTAGNWKYYFLDIPVGATELQVIGTGSGDPHTFVRQDSKPTLTDFDYDAYTPSPQTVIVDNPTSGRWWIGIYGHSGTSNYSLLAVVTEGMTGNVLPAKTVVRKAYTINLAITDQTNASDLLNNLVLATGRLYRTTDFAGRQCIRAKKSADSAYLIADASIGDTHVLVANVEPWRASLRGYLLINVGLTTSETRRITTAEYDPATGNAITLAVSGTGLTRSGATLSGGSTSVPASGTVTVSAASGDLVVTVWGIPITYTVDANDIDDSVAGMLASLINADPNLRQYVRAVWNEDNVVHIYATVGKLSFAAALVNNHTSQLDSPITAPSASATGSGTLTPGDYYLGFSDVDGSGNETLMSPLKKITIASGQKVNVPSAALPAGVAERNWYFSPAVNDDHVRFLLTNTGGSFTINSVADYDADFPPELNETGGETIRVMEVFNQFNTRFGSFKWVPSASQINQCSGEFVDAANGFKRTKITVNDRAHQRAIKKVNKKDVNLSGVDNYSQASRLLFAALAEERDGGAGSKWATDDAGIALEIGDAVAVNDYMYDEGAGAVVPYIVNQPIIIGSTNLTEDFDVEFAGKVYSTSLLEGQTGRKPVIISTTLKYLTEPPPTATNLVLTLAAATLSKFTVEFDFGEWAHTQKGLVFRKGPVNPGDPEPSDSTYQLLDVVTPDGNRHGYLEVPVTVGGKYWIKVVTQSQFGQQDDANAPKQTVDVRPPAIPAIVGNFDSVSGDLVNDWSGVAYPQNESYEIEYRNGPGAGATTIRGPMVVTPTPLAHTPPMKITHAGAPLPDGQVTLFAGGVSFTFNVGDYDIHNYTALAQSKTTTLAAGTLIEFELQAVLSPVVKAPRYMRVDTDDNSSTFYWYRIPNYTTTNDVYAPEFFGSAYQAVPGDRLGILFREDGIVEYHVNYLGPGAKPLYTSPNRIDLTKLYRVNIKENDPTGPHSGSLISIKNIRWTRFAPEFVYIADSQKADNGGSLPATVYVRVRQRSPLPNSPAGDWTYASFVR